MTFEEWFYETPYLDYPSMDEALFYPTSELEPYNTKMIIELIKAAWSYNNGDKR